jgi:hypothetical protein
MCLKRDEHVELRIISQDLRRFITITYPAAKPDALVLIVSVGVVVPLDAVQKRSCADHQRSSRK